MNIDEKMKIKLERAISSDAVKAHPTKSNLSTIKAIYVTERLNDVLGMAKWRTEHSIIHWESFMQKTKNGERSMFRAAVEVKLYVDGIEHPFVSYGGSDNDDLGDALKGAVSDAITKIAAVHFHVGIQVYKGMGNQDRPEELDIDTVREELEAITTLDDLKVYYQSHQGRGASFAKMVTARKQVLLNGAKSNG